ncbi:hypothetical protein EVAR_47005_1 [Eumeta japonica]|uniref:Uncharacterized protein n=1 Tax=Eumeta variegata TaxID=151549 RepID=A0A4C1X7T9_EUMVA|nr:hypothetical protein EVAR_47005_1 [Eumeta japonica]
MFVRNGVNANLRARMPTRPRAPTRDVLALSACALLTTVAKKTAAYTYRMRRRDIIKFSVVDVLAGIVNRSPATVAALNVSKCKSDASGRGCGWESLMKSVTLGNVTMSHRTREPAECLRLSHSTMIGLPRSRE